ncbi:hypothetical protein EV294_112126 [Paenibacillus sp. BK033]|nr:hypothetical protein [Paenibacillus sp. BK033]TCM89661.1 hypothetical protein EV294_112126 [Paenibacillus sp. BK033]
MKEVIDEVKNAINCAKSQDGEAISCTVDWLEMVLDALVEAERFRRLV